MAISITFDTIEGDDVVNNVEESDGVTVTGTFTLDPGQTLAAVNPVTIFFGSGFIVTDVNLVSGTTYSYSYTFPAGFVPDGPAFTYSLTVTDDIGGTLTDVSQPFAVDTMAPAAPSVSLAVDTTDGLAGNNTDGVSSDATVDVIGLEGGATWEYQLDGTGWVTGMGTDFELPSQGVFSVEVRQTDAAGNTSAASTPVNLEFDSVGPAITSVTSTDTQITEVDDGTLVTVNFVFDGPISVASTVSVAVNAGATTAVSGAPGAAGGFAVPNTYQYQFLVADADVELADITFDISGVVDAAGNPMTPVVGLSSGIAVDTFVAEPSVSLATDSGASGTDGITNVATVNVADLEAGGTWEYSLDGGGSWLPGTGSTFDLPEGPSSVSVRQTDAAGNMSTESAPVALGLDSIDPASLDAIGADVDTTSIDEYADPNGATPAGDVIASFVNDDAGLGELTYTFAPGSNTNGAFALVVNGANTELQVADPTLFDYEVDDNLMVDIVTTDLAGNTSTDTYFVNLNDLNDAPEIAAGSDIADNLVERVDLAPNENNPVDFGLSGTVNFTDDDITDSHSVSVSNISSTSGSFLGVFLAGLSDPAAGDGEGAVSWTFGNTTAEGGTEFSASEMATIDALGVGETIVQVFRITVTELGGASPLSVDQDVTITITGTNDAPTVGVVAAGDGASGAVTETDATMLTVSDTLTVADVDLTDVVSSTVQSVSINSGSDNGLGNAALLTLMGVAGDLTNAEVTDVLTWTFNSGANTFDYLSDGDSLVLDYVIRVDDGTVTADQVVQITINGSNDQPTIGAATVDATALRESGDGVPGTAVAFGDVSAGLNWGDLDSGEQALLEITEGSAGADAQAALVFDGSGFGAFPGEATITGTYGRLYFEADGSYAYVLDDSFAATQALDDGDMVTEVFNYTIANGPDADDMATSTVTFNIEGSNDAPTIGVVSGDDSASATIEESDASMLTASDTLTIGDVDTLDVVSSTVQSVSINSGSDNGLGNAALLALMGVTGDLDNTEITDVVMWTFNSGANTFDYLGATESLVLDYVIRVDDGTTTSDQTVQITINGTNDQPVIATGDTSILSEIGGVTGGAGVLSDSGTLSLSDDDINDTHTITDTLTSAVWDDGTGMNTLGDLSGGLPAGLAALIAVDAAFAADNATTNEDIDWTFDLNDSDVDFLAAGETLTITYTISADDGGGFDGTGDDESSVSASQTVVVTITGTNDVPTLGAESFTINDQAGVDDATLSGEDMDTTATAALASIDGFLDGADVDVSDDLDYAIFDGMGAVGSIMLSDGGTDYGTLTVNADGSYSFAPIEAAINALDETEIVTLTTMVQVTDGTATTMNTFTITIDGENDDPVIVTPPSSLAISVSEYADGATMPDENVDDQVESLTFEYDDAELADVHTTTIVPVAAGDTPALADYVGTFSSGFPDVATGPGTGTGTFQFTVNDGVLDNLTAGEQITQRYQIQISDDAGGSVARDIVITITGTNDTPVIEGTVGGSTTVTSDTAAEQTLMTGDATPVTAGGTIVFSDVDISSLVAGTEAADTHTATATFVSAVQMDGMTVLDTNTTTDVGGVTAGAITAVAGSADAHEFDWDFSVADSALDYLAAGETLTVTYNITVQDDSGDAATDSVSQEVSVVITGTNDVPTVSVVGTDSDAESIDEANGTLMTDGTLSVEDVDVTDVVTVSVTSVVESGDVSGIANGTLLSMLGVDMGAIIDGANTTGTINWSFDSDGEAFDYLTDSQSLDLTFVVTVADDNGAMVTQNIVVTINGTNDQPTIAAATVDPTALREVGVGVTGTASATGDVSTGANWDDLDDGETALLAITEGSAGAAAQAALVFDGSGTGAMAGEATLTGTYGRLYFEADGSYRYVLDDTFATTEALDNGEMVSEVFNYTIDNGPDADDEATSTVTFNITGSNDAPDITVAGTNDAGAVVESGVDGSNAAFAGTPTATGTLDRSDVDGDDDASNDTWSIDGAANGHAQVSTTEVTGTYGTLTIDQNGVWTYTLDNADADTQALDVGDTPTETFTIGLSDNDATNEGTDTQTIVVTITGTNDAPVLTAVAGADVDVTEDGVVAGDSSASGSFTVADVDANDTLLSDTWTIEAAPGQTQFNDEGVITTTGVYGSIIVDDNGNWSYTLNDADPDTEALDDGDTDTEVFTVRVADGNGGFDEETVTINVTGANDAPVVVALDGTTDDNSAPFTIDLLTDASDVDALDVLSIINLAALTVSTGDLVLNLVSGTDYTLTDSTLEIDPTLFDALDLGESAQLIFNFEVSDGTDTTANTFTLDIDGINDAPIANDDATSVDEGQLGTFNVVTGPEAGMVVDTDAEGHTITVISAGDVADAASGQPLGGGGAVGVTPVVFDTDWGATVTVFQSGLINYNLTSASAEFNALAEGDTAVDTFEYTISDGNGGTDTATVSITIVGTNDPITANADTIAATENDVDDGMDDTDILGDLTANDTDVDVGDTTTVTAVTAGINVEGVTATVSGFDVELALGIVIRIDAAGTYEVIIPESMNATDVVSGTFSYTVQDGGGDDSTATVSFTVNGLNDNPEVAGPIGQTSDEDDANFVFDLLDGATDIDNGDVINVDGAVTVVSGDDGGITQVGDTLSIDHAAYQYLNVGDSAVIEYSYDIVDGNGGTVAQTATITIEGTNDAPTVAAALTGGADEDDAGFTVDMLDGADDVDNGAVLSVSSVTGLVDGVTVAGSTLSVDPTDASFQSLDQGEDLVIVVSYDVEDENGATVAQTATITITGTNDIPTVAAALTAGADEDDAGFDIDMLAGADDVDDGAILSVANVMGLVAGVTVDGSTISVDPSDASFQSLAVGETAIIEVDYDVEDQFGTSVPQTATITITGTNDDPTVAAALTAGGNEDGAGFTVDMLDGADDVDNGAILSVANVMGLVAGVTFAGSTLTVDPTDASFQSLFEGETLDIVVSYDVVDGDGGSVAQTATITITGTNDAPTVAAALIESADEDAASFSIDMLAGADDVDNNAVLTVTNIAGLVAGVTVDGTTINVDPSDASFQSLAVGEELEIVVSYDVEDEFLATVSQTATITIVGTNDDPTVDAALSAAANEDDAGFTVDMLQGANDVDNGAVLSVANVMGLVDGITVSGTTISVDPTDANFQSLSNSESLDIVIAFDVVDGEGGSVAQTATINLIGTNDAPTVEAAITADADEDGVGFDIDMLSGASDVDNGAVLSVTNIAGLVGGVTVAGTTISVDPSDANFQSLALGEELVVVVSYDVADEFFETVSQTATITITGTNDAPTVEAALTDGANEDDASFMVNLLDGANDVDNGDIVTVENVTGLVPGVTLVGPDMLSVDPSDASFQSLAAGEELDIVVSYDLVDIEGASVAQTVTVTITGTNDAASISGNNSGALVEDDILEATGELSVADIDNGENQLVALAAGTASDNGYGTFEVAANGEWTFTLDNDGVAVQGLAVGEVVNDTIEVFSADGTASEIISVTITGAVNVITGTPEADVLVGQVDENVISGLESDDTITGGAAADTLIGGAGADTITGGGGFDTTSYVGSSAGVTVSLEDGTGVGGDAEGDILSEIEAVVGSGFDDVLTGAESQADSLEGAGGDDMLFGLSGDDTLTGGDGADILNGGAGADTLDGGAGDQDFVDYSDSSAGVVVRLFNGTGLGGDAQGDVLSDIEGIIGTAFTDVLLGSSTNGDTLIGGEGNDTIFGLAGNDILIGGAGADNLDGGESLFDVIDYSDSSASVTIRLFNGSGQGGDAQDDIITNVESVIGSDFNDVLVGSSTQIDTLEGGAGNDVIFGLAGNDTLIGGAGADTLDGGVSNADVADYSDSSAGVTVRLFNGTGVGGDAEGDTLVNIESVVGSVHNDVLVGTSTLTDILRGNDGMDSLFGLAGNDIIDGGAGNDLLSGGVGNDVFIFADGFGQDTVTDFADTFDRFDVSGIAGVTSIDDFTITQEGDDVLIKLDDDNTILVEDTLITDIDADDFIF